VSEGSALRSTAWRGPIETETSNLQRYRDSFSITPRTVPEEEWTPARKEKRALPTFAPE